MDRFDLLLKKLQDSGIHSPTNKLGLRWLWRQSAVVARKPDAKIVELGTLNGSSSIIMADGLRVMRERQPTRDSTSHIWTVDNYSTGADYEKVKDRIRSQGCSEFVTAISQDDLQFLKSQGYGSINMLFVDSGHIYQHVKETLEVCMSKMATHSLVCGHDYCWLEHGVVYAVEDWREKYKANLSGFAVHTNIWWSIVRHPVEI